VSEGPELIGDGGFGARGGHRRKRVSGGSGTPAICRKLQSGRGID
jgi:hypothetical protein